MWRSFAIAIAVAGIGSAARADTIEILSGPSTEGLGSFTGSVSYDVAPLSTTGFLTIVLTNTSDAGNGGYITGFLFNIGGTDAGATATLEAGATHPFLQATGGGLDGAPWGVFDAGAALGGSFNGGGNPTPGIAVGAGESGTFVFAIDAADASSMSAADFLNPENTDYGFIVRFRGFLDGGSDKVAAVVVPIPAAGLLGLAGLGLVGVATRRRRTGL